MKHIDPKITMLEHSESKVTLYGTYLSIFLNILSRAPSVTRIFIFDLLCGEGLYQNGSKGSPLIALDTIKNHYYANGQTCPDMTIWFNDNGMSEIEPNVLKVDRLRTICSRIFVPRNVDLNFFREDYDNLLPKALTKLRKDQRSKSLFFIDPYGYKDIRPKDIRDILQCGNTEVLLFLPIAHMYRFAETSLRTPFPGSEPLRDFLTELFGNTRPTFRSVYDFITQLKQGFRAYTNLRSVFVDTFTIERDATNVYCLFFFTSHIRGYEKMLEAKWKVDASRGKGYKLNKSLSFFSEIELSGYTEKLFQYIRNCPYRTNREIYRFGLENGFLPKHTNKILRTWKKRKDFKVFSLDDKPVKGFYIAYESERAVGFKIS